jgi:hypothetical protein
MPPVLSITYEIPWYPSSATAWLFWVGLALDLGGLIRAERLKTLGNGTYRVKWALLGLVVSSLLELRDDILLPEIPDYDQLFLGVTVLIDQALAGLAITVLSVAGVKLAGWMIRRARKPP